MNPYDIFPPRNLPPESDPWGREIQERVRNLEYNAMGISDEVDGQNRSNAATLSDVARQVVTLGETVERVDELFRALPITRQASNSAQGFGLSGSQYNTLLSVSIESPFTGTVVVQATATGQQVSGGVSNPELQVQLVCQGEYSPIMLSVPGASTATYTAGYGWTQDVTQGQNVQVSLRVYAPATWPSRPLSYAALTALMTFTGS